MPDILHFLRIQAAPERVYQAITTAEGIRNWWTRDADLDGYVGGRGEFRFPHYGGNYVTQVVIQALQPCRRVQWFVRASFRPEWDGTSIDFTLRPDNGTTILLFAHRNFAQADERYAQVNTGWAYYLVSLQRYLETGQGAPSPDVDFAILVQKS
jgi:uncharacterized protein YndB with AHSA1/START domain